MKKILFVVAVLASSCSAVWAVTFSAGGGKGVSIVDASGTGDYTSLAAAAADFTSYAGGATGDWTVLIRSNLTETTSALFGNDTNSHKVTIRPDVGTSVTVTYNIQERPATTGVIWDGCIIVGPNQRSGPSESPVDPTAIQYKKVDNFTIDGCNSPGGTERNLTFITPPEADGGTAIPRYTVRVVGWCDNAAIRNCTIEQHVVGSGGEGYICVLVNSRFISEGSLFFLPNGVEVTNCGLYAFRGNTGRGFYCIGTGPSSSGIDAMKNFVVSDNDIHVSHRAVQFGFNAGGEISYNRIRITQETAGSRPEVIIHTGSNNVTYGWTTDIIGNHISQIDCLATNGWNYAFGVTTANAESTINIVNNMVGGITGTATITTANGMLGRLIALENGTNPGTLNIRHNSFSVADIPSYGPAGEDDTNNRLAGLSLLNANNFAGTINFENNIFSYRQHNGSLISNGPTQTAAGTLNFNNNTYHLGTGAKFAELNGTTYATLADWQSGTSRDTASNVVDPFAPPSGGAWISDSDPHFNADAASVFDGVTIAGITTDIDGQIRPNPPTKGADEFLSGSSVDSWSLY